MKFWIMAILTTAALSAVAVGVGLSTGGGVELTTIKTTAAISGSMFITGRLTHKIESLRRNHQ